MFSTFESLRKALEKRKQNSSFRSLVIENKLIDFCSTDYLGFAKSDELKKSILEEIKNNFSFSGNLSGSSGSRLMRGNYLYTENLENKIANHHKAEASLIFNSGYDANVGFFSCVPQRGDIILHDELIHVSSREGMRLSFALKFSFRHNDVNHLEEKLKKFKGKNIFVSVESVYSMDGDFSPLEAISGLCEKYQAHLVVDEAHATGLYGPNGAGRIVELGLEKKTFAVIHTFGKALGCHGGAIAGSRLLREFLINFSHSFIYSTAIPPINILALNCAYDLLTKSNDKIYKINYLINLFKDKIKMINGIEIIPGFSPIQCLIIPGNERVKNAANKIRESGYDVRAVLSPTVPGGRERLRVCLHSFNSPEELEGLVLSIKKNVLS